MLFVRKIIKYFVYRKLAAAINLVRDAETNRNVILDKCALATQQLSIHGDEEVFLRSVQNNGNPNLYVAIDDDF